jgi:putative PIG3 family NAD(P)H quinone oxidoreductase
MKAIVVKRTEGEPTLSWEDVPDVTYGPDEVLVDIKATAVNRADLLQARGDYPPPPGESEILGLEMCGVVAAVGDTAKGWQVGDCVLGLLAGGGYAEQVAVHPQMLIPLPDSWAFTVGAAVPEVWLTAFSNLFLEGSLQSGERVLIHAGGSGVGTAGIQLCLAAGATAYVTAGSATKLDKCRELGASLAVNYKEQDFFNEVMEFTDNHGVDLILDPVGAAYLTKNINLLAVNGRLINIGLMGGSETEINLGAILGKSLRIIGTRLRPRPLAEKISITREFENRFWSMLAEDRLQPVIDSVFPIEEAQAAHRCLRQNKNIGKVVLEM